MITKSEAMKEIIATFIGSTIKLGILAILIYFVPIIWEIKYAIMLIIAITYRIAGNFVTNKDLREYLETKQYNNKGE